VNKMFKKNSIKKVRKILKKRIILMLDEGKAKEEIIKKAEKIGWKKELIDEIFREIGEDKKKKKEIKVKVPFLKKKEEIAEKKENFNIGLRSPISEEPEKPEELKQLEEQEPKRKGLVGQLQELNEKIDIISQRKKSEKKLKKKKFKIPFMVKSQLKKLAVKNKVQVMLLQRTRNIKPVIGEVREGMLLIKDMIYNGSVDSTWLWNGKFPTMIVPEWDLQPLTPEGISEMKATTGLSSSALKDYCIKFGRSAEPEKIIIRAIEAKQNQMLKGKANVKVIILVIIGTIVAMAVLFGGGVI